jgi:hypothetical protein
MVHSFSRGHPVVLGIILKWNKIYTSSNTTILYKLIKYKIVMFDKVYILFQINDS